MCQEKRGQERERLSMILTLSFIPSNAPVVTPDGDPRQHAICRKWASGRSVLRYTRVYPGPAEVLLQQVTLHDRSVQAQQPRTARPVRRRGVLGTGQPGG